MKRMFLCIALLQIYLLIPGTGELTQDLIHYAINGDTHHQRAEAEDHTHDTQNTEHGCSGPYHVCGCHASVVFTPTLSSVQLAMIPPKHLFLPSWFAEFQTNKGFSGPPFKPPIR